ncbi:HlyD family secretion protein [Paraburkholderia sp. MMS20-SJTN17]|uniref:HlyD family secretion protein n=1 Tax=Paraburkholderia translucens TaxID=2886945 RepID=A0ABS8KMC6_9BURK|nr:HlyD family secretion protein [Paraburkholderia sp. MMS20-SJTN17]MCC8405880.1 HlyD family secretion protein [Paraburkholderia sp. MMS20-SJTN17]
MTEPRSDDHSPPAHDEPRRNEHGERNASTEAPGNGDGSDGSDGNGGERKRPGKKPLIVLSVVVVVLGLAAFGWWFATRNQEGTDDAYTDGNAITIAPKVSGYVSTLAVDDNTRVRKGDLMVVIDRRDYQTQVDAARAQLGLAQAQLKAVVKLDVARVQYPAQYAQAKAQVESAHANLREAQASYERQHAVDIRATSQQNIDVANAENATAAAHVDEASAQLRTAALVPQQIRQVEATVEERRQQVRQAEVQLEQAELNLSWCEVRAPSDGWITRRNVQYGTFLQAGTTLFSIVTPEVWITANYKETQLDRLRPGDKVTIKVDAYPELELHGHVQSVQLGSDSRFSAFPAENATGNFVKIVIDDGLPKDHPLPRGLSVEPTVYVRP